MDLAKGIIIDALDSMEQNNVAFMTKGESFDKNAKKSIEAREQGNLWFTSNNHDEKVHEEIWKLYTSSIAFAPLESEPLAVAFANRSAFLLHIKKYESALIDIERVLKMTNCSSALKVKLFCRQAQCYVALQSGKQSGSLEKAKFWLEKVEVEIEKPKLNKMVEKTQEVIEKNESHCQKKKEKLELNCENNAVSLCYDKKLGRGLIATRDIKPGDLVYVEEFHAVSVNKSKRHAYCSHCLGISWTLIPCDHCAYYLYCGEKCKTEAWNKYHDVECRMKCMDLFNHFVLYYIELGIRSLIMAIKEAGSIDKLRKLVSEIDNCKDTKTKGFLKDGKFMSDGFRSLCSFKGSTENLRTMATAGLTAIALQSLTKNTDIFGNDLPCHLHLKHNEDVVFVGSLLLRWIFSFMQIAFSVQSVSEHCSTTEDFLECLENFCCSRGMSISLVTSLINHSCDNNVNKLYTNDGRVVYYASKPIKANTQIFSSYYVDYTLFDRNSRQGLLSVYFEFRCNCVACQQDWPTASIIYKNDTPILLRCPAKYNESILDILKRNNDILTCLKEESRHKFSKKEIQSMAKDIAKVYAEKTQEPNLATAAFHSGFRYMMEKNYFDVLNVPRVCTYNESKKEQQTANAASYIETNRELDEPLKKLRQEEMLISENPGILKDLEDAASLLAIEGFHTNFIF